LSVLVLLGAALALTLAGCGRMQQADPTTKDNFSVTLATDPAPPVATDGAVANGAVANGTVIVTLRDAAGQPVEDAQLALEANMSHAGMTPVIVDGASTDGASTGSADGKDGVYRVPLTWTMAGDWYVDIRFTLPDGQKIARRFPVQVLAQ